MEAANNAVQTAKESIESVGKQISETKLDPQQISSSVQNSVQNVSANVTSTLADTKESLTNTINDFSSQTAVKSGEDYLNSNSIIAKFVFIIFILVVFLVLLNLGVVLITYFLQNTNPYVINGSMNGNANQTILQNPNNPDSVLIYRSNNQSKGMEATWSVWLLINDINDPPVAGQTTYRHIFNKGNAEFIPPTTTTQTSKIGVASVNNAPGVYLTDNAQNTLRIYMDTINDNDVYVDVTNIPLKKWFHMAIRIQNNIMDIYINGTISARHVFKEVPKQNYDDINIGCNGGFNGNISNLIYYSRALGIFDINNIILSGPNTNASGASASSTSSNYSSYLSNMWYTSKM